MLISGDGSNLQAIINAIKNNEINAEIKTVISNQVNAIGLERAHREKIKTRVVNHKRFSSRELFDQALIKIIDPLKPDLVILAGFMRILSDHFIDHYSHRLINIHPSLLPKYKGLNTHQRVIDNRDVIHGASVHFVNHELDSGQIILQAEIPVHTTDNAKTLAVRVLKEEHKIYPLVIKMHDEGRLTFDKNQLHFDNKPLTKPLRWENNQLRL